MQSLIKYATAAAFIIGNASAYIVRNATRGSTSAAVTYPVDANCTLSFQTYSNGTDLALVGFVNITDQVFVANRIYNTTLAYLGSAEQVANRTDVVSC